MHRRGWLQSLPGKLTLLDRVKIVSGVPSKGTVLTQRVNTVANIVNIFAVNFGLGLCLTMNPPAETYQTFRPFLKGPSSVNFYQGIHSRVIGMWSV